jgi:hypothetical protein
MSNVPASGIPAPPGAPLLRFSAQNVDGLGTNNAGIVDGSLLSTIVNLGSQSGANVTGAGAARFTFTKVAPSNKIRGFSCFTLTGAQFMQSAGFTLIAQPLTWVLIYQRGAAASEAITAGSAGNTNQTYYATNNLNMSAGTQIVAAFTTVSGNWNCQVSKFSAAASGFHLNGIDDVNNPQNANTLGIDQITLGNNPGATAPFTGLIAEVVVYGSSPPSNALIDAWAANYGSFPQ